MPDAALVTALAAVLEPIVARVVHAELRAVGMGPPVPGLGAWRRDADADRWVDVTER